MKRISSVLCFVVIATTAFAQWDVVYYGGDNSNDIDLFFLNSDTGFVIGVSTDAAYILRTHDGGATWDSTSFFGQLFLRSIYFSSIDTGYVVGYSDNLTILRSINGGDSWQEIASIPDAPNYFEASISFFDNDHGILTIQTWSAKTEDAGLTWIEIDDYPGGGQGDSDVDGDNFVGGSGIIYVHSSDRASSFDVDTLPISVSHLSLDAFQDNFIASAIGSNGINLGFPLSSFGVVIIADLENEHYEISYFPTYSRVLGVSMVSENVLYSIATSIYLSDDFPNFFIKSIDGGHTWYHQQTSEYGYPGTNKIFCVNDSVCYAVGGYNGKIYKTTNGGGPLLEEVDQIILSAENIDDHIEVSLFPNPARETCVVSVQKEPISNIGVFDLQGKLIKFIKVNGFRSEIGLEGFDTGIYFIQISTASGSTVKKLIVE